ncbi:MAG: hypothetical protein Q7R41_16955, partial [Phycisphaerales bacterium]|nr:hypothetical protein [Phycisphaerales bacterium]
MRLGRRFREPMMAVVEIPFRKRVCMPETSELFPHAAHRIAPIFILIPTVLVSPGVSRGQLLERATVIRNARVIVEPGRVIENASILIKGEKIEAVGNDVRAPFLAQAFDASGKTVTTGLIDAWSGLGRLGGSDQADPTSDAWDRFDRYARDDFREALRNGVTTVYVGPESGPGIGGTGVIVQLAPAGAQAAGELLDRSVALHINLASNQSVVSRMKTFAEVRKQFRKALDYRQALEDYEEDVKDYLDKLKERREKKEAKDKPKEAGDKKEAGEKKDAKPKEDKPPADKPKLSPEDQNPGINAGASNGAEQTFLGMMSAEAFQSGDGKKNDKPEDKGDKKEGDEKDRGKKNGD